MVLREISITDNLMQGKVLIIYGARRVGKTYLLLSYLQTCGLKYKLDTGDDIRIQELFSSNRVDKITEYAEGYELIAIDEAQRIKDIGLSLKILVDNRPDLKIIVTGSSSFEINKQLGEPLTGRKKEIMLFPFFQKGFVKNGDNKKLSPKKINLLSFFEEQSYFRVQVIGLKLL